MRRSLLDKEGVGVFLAVGTEYAKVVGQKKKGGMFRALQK